MPIIVGIEVCTEGAECWLHASDQYLQPRAPEPEAPESSKLGGSLVAPRMPS